MNFLHYLPYVLFFMAATMVLYGWGLLRAQRARQTLENRLAAKGISKIRKALRRRGALTRQELAQTVQGLAVQEPFSKNRLAVTEPDAFLNVVLPYMVSQKQITQDQDRYQLR